MNATLKNLDTSALKTKILRWANGIQSWNIEWVTGMYPGEMAALLGLFDLVGVKSIVESGRGLHAYSTQVLGRYSDIKGIKVVSIDFSPIEDNPFAPKLQVFKNLEFHAGDAFDVFPKAISGLQGPIGLLLDGPKYQKANRFSLVANMLYDIHVIAHHNASITLDATKEFKRIFPGAYHYEDLDLSSIEEWQIFKQWEYENVSGWEFEKEADDVNGFVGRSLEQSALVMTTQPPKKLSVRRLFEFKGFRVTTKFHPFRLWLKWIFSH